MRREVAWSGLELEWVLIENLARDRLDSGRGSRLGLDWYGLAEMSGCSDNVTRSTLVSGRGYRWGLCILRFWEVFRGLKGYGLGGELAWYQVAAKRGLVDGLDADPLGSGCKYH